MSLLETRLKEGARAALAALGMGQPSLGSVGIKAPTSAPGLPGAPKAPTPPKAPALSSPGVGSTGGGTASSAPKVAFNVGMGASTSTDGTGAAAGEPADTGRRQRSVIDRALQSNEDAGATSSMPEPGSISP